MRPFTLRRRRGIALADFIAGMVIFSAVMVAFADLTRSKFMLLSATELQTRGQAACEERLDRLRSAGLRKNPGSDAQVDVAGFRLVETFDLDKKHRLPEGKGRISVRSLRMFEGDPHQLYEARVTITWRDVAGTSRASMTTVLPRPGGSK